MAVHTLLHENEYLCSCGERLLFDLYQPLRSISILYYSYIVLVFLKVFLGILTGKRESSLTPSPTASPPSPPLQGERGVE